MLKENLSFSPQDIEQNKVIAALCNFPLLFWLGFVAAPNSEYAKYNANHGLCFLIASVVIGFIQGLLSGILAHLPFFSGLFSFIFGTLCWVLSGLLTASVVVCIIFAVTKPYEIPVLDNIKIIK